MERSAHCPSPLVLYVRADIGKAIILAQAWASQAMSRISEIDPESTLFGCAAASL
ncbi:hypothetical protein NBRC116588_09420 [Pyruvatibacter sp. HU-CL02332]